MKRAICSRMRADSAANGPPREEASGKSTVQASRFSATKRKKATTPSQSCSSGAASAPAASSMLSTRRFRARSMHARKSPSFDPKYA